MTLTLDDPPPYTYFLAAGPTTAIEPRLPARSGRIECSLRSSVIADCSIRFATLAWPASSIWLVSST